ncbi:MAG: hypothetical protein H6872_05680 [Methylobacteriaceae bacterium]|nr:hypothetical protein [Methylobacteriaceae bacterium]
MVLHVGRGPFDQSTLGHKVLSAHRHLRSRHAVALENMNCAWRELERSDGAAEWLSGAVDCEEIDQLAQLLALWKGVAEVQGTGRELVGILEGLLAGDGVSRGQAAEIVELKAFYEEIDREVLNDVAIINRVVLRVEVV